MNGRGTAEKWSALLNSGTAQLSDEIPESELVDRIQASSHSSFSRFVIRFDVGEEEPFISTDRLDLKYPITLLILDNTYMYSARTVGFGPV